MNDELLEAYPELKIHLERDPGWLDQALTTEEVSKITGISIDGLCALRSRGNSPHYVKPQGSRHVRYFRRDVYSWLLADGKKTNTFDGE